MCHKVLFFFWFCSQPLKKIKPFLACSCTKTGRGPTLAVFADLSYWEERGWGFKLKKPFNLGQPLWKMVWSSPKQQLELPNDPAIPLLGIYPPSKEEDSNSKRYIHPSIHCTMFTTAKMRKQPKCPQTDEWVKKMWYRHTYTYTHTHTHMHTPWNITQPQKRVKSLLFAAVRRWTWRVFR